MSRLKGADLGVVTPTAASLGAAKCTAGAGQPSFAGRTAGDLHYDTAAKVLYVLQGSPGTTYSDTFDAKTPGATLSGLNTEVGGKTWGSVGLGVTAHSLNVQNGGAQGDGAGGWPLNNLAGLPATGRTLSADLVIDSGFLGAGGVESAYLCLGDTTNMQDGPASWRFWPLAAGLACWLMVDGVNVINQQTLAQISALIDNTKLRHTFGLEIHTDKTVVATIDGIVVWSGTCTRAIGQYDTISIGAGANATHHRWDNFSDALQGTQAWTPTTVAAALNFRGDWSASPSPAYAVNDLVTRNGAGYIAQVAPGSADPAVKGIATLGGIPYTVIGSSFNFQSAMAFTVSSRVLVSGVRFYAPGNAAIGAGQVAGISADFVQGAVPNFLAQGVVATQINNNGSGVVQFTQPIVLLPGTTYRLVIPTGAGWATSGTQTGALATAGSPGSTWYGATFQNSQGAQPVSFDLVGPAWSPLASASPLNSRGWWTATPSSMYAVNDVVQRNGVAYLATVPPGFADPVGGSTLLGGCIGIPGNTSGTPPVASRFQVSAPVTVTSVDMYAWAAITAGQVVGISSEFAQNGTPSYLGQGVTPAIVSGQWGTITLDKPVTLWPGINYRFVSYAGIGSAGGADTGVLVQGPAYSLYWGAGFANNFTTGSGGAFRLNGNPWFPLVPLAENVNTVAASGAAVTLPDISTATMHKVTLTANATITLPTPGPGKRIRVQTQQDGTGARTLAWATPAGAIRWPGGAAPAVSVAANAIDVVELYCVDGVNWFGHDLGRALA